MPRQKKSKKKNATNTIKTKPLLTPDVFKFHNNSNHIVTLYQDNKWRSNLLKIMFKSLKTARFNFKTVVRVINSNLNKENSDAEIIKTFRKMVRHSIQLYNPAKNMERARRKWQIIRQNIIPGLTIKSILDFGGNVGDSAFVYGCELKLDKKNIFVCDIDEWAGEKWTPRDDITFVHYDDMKKIPSNRIDLITITHVLHHINKKEFPKIISEFNRILTQRGIIVLYEHNSNKSNFSTLIDLEHMLYDIVTGHVESYSKFIDNFYAEYFTIDQWKIVFSAYFKEYFTLEKYSVDKSFYLFLRRK